LTRLLVTHPLMSHLGLLASMTDSANIHVILGTSRGSPALHGRLTSHLKVTCSASFPLLGNSLEVIDFFSLHVHRDTVVVQGCVWANHLGKCHPLLLLIRIGI
jgi:hypothetical protein